MSYQVTKPFIAALFHDIGKFYRKVLGERESHQSLGERFFEDLDKDVSTIIRYHHHERDGLNLDSLRNDLKRAVKIVEKADRFVSSITRDEEEGIYNKDFYPPWILIEHEENKTKDLSKYGFKYGIYAQFLWKDIVKSPKEVKEKAEQVSLLIKERLKKQGFDNKDLYSILTLLREITLFVQSYSQSDYPGTSLYSHLYFTSAFAYLFKENIVDPYLVVIEATGIQDFIGKIIDKDYTSKGTAKIFRGRSLFVEIITELLALELVEELEVPYTLITSFSSGKIHMIVPKEKINIVDEKIKALNWFLLNNSFYPMRFVYGFSQFTLDEKERNSFAAKWKKVIEEAYKSMTENKLSIKGPLLETYFDSVCDVCGEGSNTLKEKDLGGDEKLSLCYACRLSFNIGQEVLRREDEDFAINHFLYFSYSRSFSTGSINIREFKIKAKISDSPIGEFNRLYPLTTKIKSKELFDNSILLKIKDKNIGFTYNYPLFNSVKMLDELFDKNMNKIAFVKMDVDSLGELYKKSTKLDISKSLEISELITFLIKYLVGKIISGNDFKVYPLYIGGDDIIIGGKPIEMLKFIKLINGEIMKISNNHVRLSSAYVLLGRGTPIRDVFTRLESLLRESKTYKDKENKVPGISFSFIPREEGRADTFEDFVSSFDSSYKFIESILTSKQNKSTEKSNSLLYKLLEIRRSRHRHSKKAKMVEQLVSEYLRQRENALLDYVKAKRKINFEVPDLWGLYFAILINKSKAR